MRNILEIRHEDDKLHKISLAAMYAAVAVLLSGFSFPVGPSRCFPFQHAINVIAGITLGPWWALASAVVASTVRNFMGTGTILAFPGSIFGALAVGFFADALPRKHRFIAAIAEPLATGTAGAWISSLIMAQQGRDALFSMLSVAFLSSSAPGALIGFLVLCSLAVVMRRMARQTREQ